MAGKSLLALVIVLALCAPSSAQKPGPSTGINFRLSFWNMGNEGKFLTYVRDGDREFVKTGGVGGWISFLSRTSDSWNLEFSLGAFGKAEGETYNKWDDDIDGTAVIPVLFGVQRDLLSIDNGSDLRPYVALGVGPYWITKATERSIDHEEVVSSVEPGGYAGGGIHFFLGQKFALNFDARYHLVDFNDDHEISGLEVGIGFTILWGQYNSGN